ncbi:MAG: hypothetical protein EHM48_05665 [Planctomycetaceae bacterium]|nr:MAG: hypothetical protein EHM48_05665 [Planctomycetaceae bacterium]
MPNYELIQSIGRALDILELVGNSESGMSLHLVVTRTHLKTATAHNILRTLAAKGFLVKRRNPIRYQAGPILLNIRRAQRDLELFNRVRPVLMSLANSLGGEARLSECVGMRSLGMLFVLPGQMGVMQPHLPQDMLPYGIGVVFQAYWSKSEIAEYDKKYNFAKNGKKWGSRQKLNRFLAEFKKRRVGMMPIRITGDHFRVAAPIFSRDGKVAAIICFIKPIEQTDAAFRDKCCQAVYQAGVALSYHE